RSVIPRDGGVSTNGAVSRLITGVSGGLSGILVPAFAGMTTIFAVSERPLRSRRHGCACTTKTLLLLADSYLLTLLASILIAVSSSLVLNAVSTANGFSMPR